MEHILNDHTKQLDEHAKQEREAVKSVPRIEDLLSEILAYQAAFAEALPSLLKADEAQTEAYYDAYNTALRKHRK